MIKIKLNGDNSTIVMNKTFKEDVILEIANALKNVIDSYKEENIETPDKDVLYLKKDDEFIITQEFIDSLKVGDKLVVRGEANEFIITQEFIDSLKVGDKLVVRGEANGCW